MISFGEVPLRRIMLQRSVERIVCGQPAIRRASRGRAVVGPCAGSALKRGAVMPAEIRVFRCLEDNVGVLVHDPATGACAAIDAPEDGPILKALDETGWRLTDILVTHRHGDHVQGIETLKRRFGCRVTAPWKARDEVPGADATVREGDTVRVGELSAQVWDTPGHCRDHIAYWFDGDKAVFAGDTLFTLGCGRVMESTYAEMWASLSR